MGFFELLALAVGLSMDAFAVSVCKGLSMKKADAKGMFLCGIWFGGFQALMPLIGFLVGSLFADAITAIDHWIVFILLSIIGGNMIREACSKEDDDFEDGADFSIKTMFALAVATSIDALAIGVSLAMAGNVNIWAAVCLIGCTTFLLSGLGVRVGSIFGDRFEKKAQVVGGIILIVLGFKLLFEHLGIF